MSHAQHLTSKWHRLVGDLITSGATIIRPRRNLVANTALVERVETEKSDDEWVEFGEDEDMEVNPACCFIFDKMHNTIESCMVHMHKQHGFFIPDIEFLKDPEGLLTYLGKKPRKQVTKHMVSKSHCKVRYGDGGEDEEAELEDFNDYNSISSDDMSNIVELGSSGSEYNSMGLATRQSKEPIVRLKVLRQINKSIGS
ncbi:hypothetical protein MKW92_041362 [Papaver armeniacum]|nr:hypothetical protein MKW92_041362 [Papaver armeniacum]